MHRPRGLCFRCYYTPGVRELYPSTSKYAQRGVGNGFLRDPPLPEPTQAKPGTEQKIAVLVDRAAARQQLFHPDDAKEIKQMANMKFVELNSEQQARLKQVQTMMQALSQARDLSESITTEIASLTDDALSDSMLIDDLESVASNAQLDFNEHLTKLHSWVLTGEIA